MEGGEVQPASTNHNKGAGYCRHRRGGKGSVLGESNPAMAGCVEPAKLNRHASRRRSTRHGCMKRVVASAGGSAFSAQVVHPFSKARVVMATGTWRQINGQKFGRWLKTSRGISAIGGSSRRQ